MNVRRRVAEYRTFGASAQFTAKLGDNAEAYLGVNFQQTTSSYTGDPPRIRGNAPTGILSPLFSTSTARRRTKRRGSGVP